MKGSTRIQRVDICNISTIEEYIIIIDRWHCPVKDTYKHNYVIFFLCYCKEWVYLRYFHLDTYVNILQRYTTRTLPAHTPANRKIVAQFFTPLLLCQVN